MASELVPTLAAAQWPKRDGLRALTAALGTDNIRWVGGAVRDTLLGMAVHDVDCATKLTPDVVIDRCREAGIRTVPTGIDHGTVTAILEDGPVEVTTLRHDVSTDGRRATIAFAQEWEEDATRRDFTINALFAHPETLEISDYFGGLDDLAARRVRFIGDAHARIREDHLRILRYYRFQARFGAELDPIAEQACEELAETLKGLSRERVSGELLNLLALPDPGATVERMFDRAVLRVILPETMLIHVEHMRDLIVREQAQDYSPAGLRRLAALLPPSPDIAEIVSARLRLSKAQRARLIAIAERTGDDIEHPLRLAYSQGTQVAIDRLLLAGADTGQVRNWDVPNFPLKGGEIVARGVEAGPEIARILRSVESQWIEEGFPDQARVQALLEDHLK